MSAHKIAEATLDPKLFTNCRVVLFEDAASKVDLFPLNVMRPSWEIRCGFGCLRAWVQELVGEDRLAMHPFTHHNAISAQLSRQKSQRIKPEADVLFLNGRILSLHASRSEFLDIVNNGVKGSIGEPLLKLVSASQAQNLLNLPGTELADELVQSIGPSVEEVADLSVRYADYAWAYMAHNLDLMQQQFEAIEAGSECYGAHALREDVIGIDRLGDHPLYVSSGVQLLPQSVISTEDGPIWIGEGSEIEPHCYLKGPLVIGPHARVKAGAVLYGGSSFGPQCRVAGEISQSVLQGYVNKQHGGFLGNSMLGEWVNLGAETVTSNLRNDYGDVKMKVGGKLVDSGERFIGLMMGDHSKSGINTMFNTGTVVGVGANVYGAGFPKRFIQSFTWGGTDHFRRVPLERTLEAARVAMPRRGRDLSREEEALLRRHYEEMDNQETGY